MLWEILHGRSVGLEDCVRRYRSVTNEDLIRNMTVEELAVTLGCPNEMGMADIECDRSDGCNCYKCLLEWLKEDVNDE